MKKVSVLASAVAFVFLMPIHANAANECSSTEVQHVVNECAKRGETYVFGSCTKSQYGGLTYGCHPVDKPGEVTNYTTKKGTVKVKGDKTTAGGDGATPPKKRKTDQLKDRK